MAYTVVCISATEGAAAEAVASLVASRLGFRLVGEQIVARAAESARALNARAYTVGGDIVFGAGRYAPGAADGKARLARTWPVWRLVDPDAIQSSCGS